MKHIFQGLADFVSRYVAIFRSAWKVRHQLEPPKRSPDELAFLPAHLELTDTPVSPAPRWAMRIIIAFFCVAFLWACFGKLDIVAVAPGKTVVSSRTKVIQPIETAVVRRILVRNGETVKKGQLLIELDATATGAESEQAEEALINAQLAATRLTALAEAIDSGDLPAMSPHEALPDARLANERQLAVSQFEAFQAKHEGLTAAIAQRRAELHTVKAMIGPLEESARIATTRAEDYAELVKDKYVGRHDYLLREQERIAAERDVAAQRNRLQEVRSALSASQEELQVLVTDTRQQTLDGLREAREQIRQLTPEVAKTARRDRLMELRAPVDGTVQQLAVHTVGGVVTPAQALLAVVPSEESLEIEATVLNKDIGFVRPGQTVTVKIESFPYTRYGYLTGTIASVSHDAAQDENLGLVFPARVRLDDARLMIDGVQVQLTSGMSLSAEIKTGKRRVISFLLSPLQQHSSESLRER
ncbi:hemolysin secretion protein D [Lysobacter arseniciresistens ZS79]|uniref:Membrane fusion protein (MFP) family protein n=1 Tax=Lysobacter arseniciresistens ZS79 TaxID=913325 RepID=A0A0A0F3Y0_9GAMM|nr:HlyD family type I secretion periplasmic adaptor subunit [Lysobacter arseniciresistens]KGM57225.1 hemolysin secretion protein D [Lysobacter arseniciresistens ZS79]